MNTVRPIDGPNIKKLGSILTTFIVGFSFAAATARRHRRRRSASFVVVVIVAVQTENAANVDGRHVHERHGHRRRGVLDVQVWRRRDRLERTSAAHRSLNERPTTFDHNLQKPIWMEKWKCPAILI